MDKTKKILISIFVCFNIFAIFVMNIPPDVQSRLEADIGSQYGPMNLWRFQYARWIVHSYTHYVGLDNRWEMFSSLPRNNWWFVFKAQYADGEIVKLPLPLQSERTFAQDTFWDFKEGKFHLNVYHSVAKRYAYGRFLCRTYRENSAQPIESVSVERFHSQILSPEEGKKAGTYRAWDVFPETLETISCR